MESLLNEKLKEVKKLREFTQKIVSISLKTDYEKVSDMIEERKVFIEKLNEINENIKLIKCDSETSKLSNLKKEIREVFIEISEMDNTIRKNINNELTNIRKSLNQPEVSSKLQIKA